VTCWRRPAFEGEAFQPTDVDPFDTGSARVTNEVMPGLDLRDLLAILGIQLRQRAREIEGLKAQF
jgi:hypothetical protein